MTISEFLLARIGEDVERAHKSHALFCGTPPEPARDSLGRPLEQACDCDWPIVRVLAECEAKRRLVATAGAMLAAGEASGEQVLRIMAEVYADHVGHRPDWRP